MTQQLTDIARVTISPETMAAAERPLSKIERIKLKRQKVMDFIESKPAGTPIRLKEFIAMGFFESEGSAHSFLATMAKRGLIARTSIGLQSYAYTVLNAKTIVPPKTESETETETETPNVTPPRNLPPNFPLARWRSKLCDLVGRTPSSIMICGRL